MFGMLTDAQWVDSRVKALPRRWERRLRSAHARRSQTDYVGANIELRKATDQLLTVRVPLDATDADICSAAEALTERCIERTSIYCTPTELRQSMERICAGQGVEPPPQEFTAEQSIARMCCNLWWRRRLRKHQGRTVEQAAIRLGYVNRNRDPYISAERLAAREQQCKRNAATLEATTATNEHGQSFTLAELADKSTANKAIRRGELMTRISGFERYADAEGHEGLFLTITCPSRFHRFTTVNGGKTLIPNTRYDADESPATAQRYLTTLWACARTAAKRQKIEMYGFRIAEPQHDGTPHWHLLLFCPPGQIEALIEILRAYALRDSTDEPGAQQHRLDVTRIDKTRGSAAGYVAKYVAKNIDGEHVGNDLDGKPAKETAKRVEAWATTWGIRQFQQIGGPPVGVWRELRRISVLPAGSPEHLKAAHRAANKHHQHDGEAAISADWDSYCRAQGGATCGRKAAIQLAKRATEKPGRYGDSKALRPFGVLTLGATPAPTPQFEGPLLPKQWVVESERCEWVIEKAKAWRFDWRDSNANSATPMQPRTRVNNCTVAGEWAMLEQPPRATAKDSLKRHTEKSQPNLLIVSRSSIDRARASQTRSNAPQAEPGQLPTFTAVL
jgi:hypothetical protein